MSDMQAMANTPEQNRDFLRGYLRAEINQKIRLEETIELYEMQLEVFTEGVVDEAETIRGLQATKYASDALVASAIEQAQKRLERMQVMKDQTIKTLDDLKARNSQMIKDGQAHMLALSEIEVDQGGFVASIIGLRDLAEFDETMTTITFKPGGSAETMIGTRLTSWKDSSQMSITKLGEVKP